MQQPARAGHERASPLTEHVISARFRMRVNPTESRVREFGEAVRAGLTSRPKSLPCSYFYDEEGSALFEEICELPEYYLTRAEAEILRARAPEIAGLLPGRNTVVEFGAGNAAKTRVLLDAMRHSGPARYVPIDIAAGPLEVTCARLVEEYPALQITAVAGTYEDGLRSWRWLARGPALILYLGSNIGNLHREHAAGFLSRIRGDMSPADRLLVGIDLRKDAAVLERAYDDAAGITARFNLNILRRINRELGGEFALENFAHRALYDTAGGRVEMHLVSRVEQRVRIATLDMTAEFAAGETIHTENSYKYSEAEIGELAGRAGLRIERQWFDSRRRFSLNLLDVG